MRLVTRVARLEKQIPPPAPGCDRCRGWRILGLGEYEEQIVDGRKRYTCAACGYPAAKVIVGVDLREAI